MSRPAALGHDDQTPKCDMCGQPLTWAGASIHRDGKTTRLCLQCPESQREAKAFMDGIRGGYSVSRPTIIPRDDFANWPIEITDAGASGC